jgi:hypothetical protein
MYLATGVTRRRFLLLAALMVGVVAAWAGGAAPAHAIDYGSWSSTVTGASPTQSGRVFRSGITSTCAAPKAYPSTASVGVALNYEARTFTNTSVADECVTISLDSPSCATTVFTVAYLGAFDPTDVSRNYLGDPGSSTSGDSFSVLVPRGATFTIVVSQVSSGTTCPFTVNVSGPNAPAPPEPRSVPAPPVVSGLSASSGAPGMAVTVSGTRFSTTAVTQVLFGDTPASFTVDGFNQITAVAPVGSGTVDVRVTGPNGASLAVEGARFSYVAPASEPEPEPAPADALESRAPVCARVPSLRGRTEAGARKVLAANGCAVAPTFTRTGEPRRGFRRIRVIRQSVQPGTRLSAGETLTLTLAPVRDRR